jgi:cell division protein ZapA
VCAQIWVEGSVKKAVTLDIAGASYRMMVDADEAHLQRLAAIVNERVAAMGPAARKRASPAQLLAMVALSLADDLLGAETRTRAIEDTTRRAITSAIARIDRRLEADAVAPVDA